MISFPLQNTADLEQLREYYELECKLAAGRDGKGELPQDFWRSYSAMANMHGGIVLLGVKEKEGKFAFNSIEKPDKILKVLFDTANPDDIFGPGSTIIIDPSSTILTGSSTIIGPSSTIIEGKQVLKRDEVGRLVAEQFRLPFVDSVDKLTQDFREKLEAMATLPRTKGKIDRKELEDLIVQVCEGHFVTISSLAKIMDRGERTLRQDFLSKLCKDKRLRRAFPDTPNHEKQAYTKA